MPVEPRTITLTIPDCDTAEELSAYLSRQLPCLWLTAPLSVPVLQELQVELTRIIG